MITCDKCKKEVDYTERQNEKGVPAVSWCTHCINKARWNMDDDTYEAWQELSSMSYEELEKVDYDLKKWCCQCKGCNNGTKVRDYGVSPWYFLHRKWGLWDNLQYRFFLCGKHMKFYKRLLKSFDVETVQNKLLERPVNSIESLIDVKFNKSNKINE